MTDLKHTIAANFSAAASSYDRYATLQQQAAHSLARRLAELRPGVPPGPILEVGCGTGALSRELVTLFPDHRLTLIDLAPGMIAANRANLLPHLDSPALIDWQVQDAEAITIRRHYALIASCLTAQWFQDLAATLSRLSEALLPGGLMLCSLLGAESFPEWRDHCRALALPCTMNPLPDQGELLTQLRALGHRISAREESITLPYPTVRDFFRALKKTGTATSATEGRLTRGQMARLLSTWQGQVQGPVTATYQLLTLLVQG